MVGTTIAIQTDRSRCVLSKDVIRKRIFAALAVAITIGAILVPLAWSDPGVSGDTGETHTVVYHIAAGNSILDRYGNVQSGFDINPSYNDSTSLDSTYEVTYSGSFFSTEYNPQVWNVNGSPRWFPITSSGYSDNGEGRTVVFTGWVYATGFGTDGNPTGYTDRRYPGEVLSETEMSAASDGDGKIHIYATWGRMVNYVDDIANVGGSSSIFNRENWNSGGDEFTNIVYVGNSSLHELESHGGVTIRGNSGSATLTITYRSWFTDYYEVSLGQNVIIDSIIIDGDTDDNSNHGDGAGGIVANGNVLVIGTGVSSSGNRLNGYTQIFGGSVSGTLTSAVVSRDPYGYNPDDSSRLDFATFVIIHSGTFSNVVAGSRGQTIDASGSQALNTYLVVRDATVLDTLVGASSGYGSHTIDGSCFTYGFGLRMYGDRYEESQLHSMSYGTGYQSPISVVLTESSILTGGPNSSSVSGNVRTFLGGDTEVWDVQAGGRRGSSTVAGTAYLEISGDTVVKHVACGSITDGNSDNPSIRSVLRSHIVVKDDALVGSVFGAGYDTYASVNNPSMYGAGSTITIDISGGTVGYVYGGGYRGSIGTQEQPISSISISISGGTILGDVFGGGRGGVDKPMHHEDGSLVQSSGQTGLVDSTGLSKVYAGTITIEISGGVIGGDVFGGGESVPVLTGSVNGGNYGSGPGGSETEVALVDAEAINILVGDCVIYGSIYGAGKGVYGVGADDVEKPRVYAIAADQNGQAALHGIEWYQGSDDLLSYRPQSTGSGAGYDYSGFARVDALDIRIVFDGYRTGQDPDLESDRVGSIYGGGMYGIADVAGAVTVNVVNSTVAECIYGGGRGVEGVEGPGGLVADTIRITISGNMSPSPGTSSGGTIVGGESTPYSVFGGGANAHTEAGAVIILLNGDSDLTGDVHAGAMGSQASSSTELMEADRYVILNGANVYGSIYGGSRFGQDQDPNTRGSRTATIFLVAGTVTQSVYGGGFQASSYMDSTIYIGTPALEHAYDLTGISPASTGSRGLWLGSIYGGGNLSGTAGEPYTSPLLMGNSVIELGFNRNSEFPQYAGSSDFITFNGDIFGQGNYSTIGGTSVVWIHDYQMPANRSILSIQRCDELYVVDSTLRLTGSSDGGVEGLTERYTLIRIGMLQLDRSILHLYTETSNIGQYRSVIEGEIATRDSCVRTNGKFSGNELVLHSGSPFTLVTTGKNNVPLGVGTVSGYTLLSKPTDDPYYGVYAMGTEAVDVESGFMVNDGAEEASVMDTRFTVADGDVISIRTWYLAGHLTLNQQLTFDAYGDGTDGRNPINVTLQLPRFYHTGKSVYTYIGGFIDPTLQDGLYLVSQNDYREYSGSHATSDTRAYVYASITSGMDGTGQAVDVATHHLENGGWARNLFGSHIEIGTDNLMTLTTDLLPPMGTYRGSVGDLGTITIHLTESISMADGVYVPVNMIDVVLRVHVRPLLTNPVEIFVTVMATPVSGAGQRYEGTGYINLPGTSGGAHAYYITGVTGLDQDGSEKDTVSMWSDTSHLGQSGWTVIRYTSDNRYNLDQLSGSQVYFGEGGIRDTTIAFDYSGDGDGFVMRMVDSENTEYIITVRIQAEVDVELTIVFQHLDSDDVEYLVATGDGINTPFRFSWSETLSGIGLPFGTVLGEVKFVYYLDSGDVNTGSDTIWNIIRIMLDEKGEVAIGGQKFDYSDGLSDLFTDPDLMTRYNLSSELKESLTVYTGFGVTVTFHGQGVTVRPQAVVVQPGQTLSQFYNNIGQSNPERVSIWDGTMPAGYHMHEFENGDGTIQSWARLLGGEYVPYSFDSSVYGDLDLYLVWEPNRYTVELTFTEGNSVLHQSDLNGMTISVAGSDTSFAWSNDCVTFSTRYAYEIVLQFGGNWIAVGTEVLDPDGIENVTVGGLNTGALSVLTPDAGVDGSTISVRIDLVEGFTLYVEYPTGYGDRLAVGDQLRLTFKQGGTGYSAVLTYGVTSVTFPILSGSAISLDVMYGSSGSTAGRTMYWTYEVVHGEDSAPYIPDDSIRGKTQAAFYVPDPEEDIHLRIVTYHAVQLEEHGTGINSIVVGYDGVPQILDTWDILFTGETITVVASSGYYFPPSYISGVREGTLNDDETEQEYIVLGTRNVVIGNLTPDVVTLLITVTLQDGGSTLTGLYRNFLTTVRIGGLTRPLAVDYDGGVQTISIGNVPYNGTGYDVNVIIEGFLSPSTDVHVIPAADGSLSASITLSLITYTVVYHDVGGNTIVPSDGQGRTSLTRWSVISDTSTPQCYVTGGNHATAVGTLDDGTSLQIWQIGVERQDGRYDMEGFSGDLYAAEFDSDGEIHLFALPETAGSSSSEMITVVVVLQEGMLQSPSYSHNIGTGLFGSADRTFRSPQLEGVAVSYSNTTGNITISGIPPGSGVLHMVSDDGYALDIHVFTDPVGTSGGMTA